MWLLRLHHHGPGCVPAGVHDRDARQHRITAFTVLLRLAVTVALFWVLPACLAVGGLHLWQKTRFPWLAMVPALVAVAVISALVFFGSSLLFGWL